MGEDINEKSKSWFFEFLSQYKKPLLLILVGVISVVALVIAFNSYGKDYVVEIINNLVKQQIKVIDDRYAEEIKTRDDQIQNLQGRLSESEKTYAGLKKRVNDVEENIKNRKAPVTSGDLRNRSNQLGYKPVN